MTAAPKKLTVDEYLALERRSETKHEYYAGEIYAMAGASYAHGVLAMNLAATLHGLLKDSPCKPLMSDLRIRTRNTLYTYPDVVVVCGTPKFTDDQNDTLTNPVVVIEVLSATTEGYDRGVKFASYRSIPSVAEYVLVSQDRMFVEHFAKQPGGQWLLTEYGQPDATVRFPVLNVGVLLSEIYAGVELPAQPALRKSDVDA